MMFIAKSYKVDYVNECDSCFMIKKRKTINRILENYRKEKLS